MLTVEKIFAGVVRTVFETPQRFLHFLPQSGDLGHNHGFHWH